MSGIFTGRIGLLLAGSSLAILCGCNGSRTNAASSRAATLVASLRSEPESFNPYAGRPDVALEVVTRLLHAPLVRINRVTDTLEPWLAERVEPHPDGLTYTLRLRGDVRFSNGAPFSADDVLASFQAAYDEEGGSYLASTLKVGNNPLAVTAPDPQTITLRFPSPYGPGLRMLDNLPILSAASLRAAYGRGRLRDLWALATPPQEVVGLGPFVLREHQSGERFLFARNPHYWRRGARGEPLPYLERLVIEIVGDQDGELLRLLSGDIDLLATEARVEDRGALERAARSGLVRVWDLGPSLDANALWFNLVPGSPQARDRAWLQSRAFRQAVAHAVNRDTFVDVVYRGSGIPVCGPVTPGNPTWFSPSAPTYPHDIGRARDLLAELGLRDRNGDGLLEDASGRPVRFALLTQAGHTARERGAAVIAHELRAIGVTVDVVALEPGSLFDRLQRADYEAMFFGIQSGSTDPADHLEYWLSSGMFHVWHPAQRRPARDWERRVDALMRRQIATRAGDERRRLFAEVQQIFAQELPAIYFAAPRIVVAASARVRNASPALLQPQILWNADVLAVEPVKRQDLLTFRH